MKTLSKASAKHSRSHTSKSNSNSNPLEEAKEKHDFFQDVLKFNDFNDTGMERITEEFPSESKPNRDDILTNDLLIEDDLDMEKEL